VIKQLKSSREDREALRDSLLFLSAAQKRVMELLGGFDDGGAKSMKEVAEMFAITPQRVWQIKHKAIKKLRQCFAEMRERSEL
jgi:DNA-directed RNA polymerase sigma subunit (sigma70/sigma32)